MMTADIVTINDLTKKRFEQEDKLLTSFTI